MSEDFSKKIWRRFILLSTLTLIVIVIQLIGTVYNEQVIKAFLWVAAILLPLLFTLLLSPTQNQIPSDPKSKKFILFIMNFYIILVLATFFMQGVMWETSRVPKAMTLISSLGILLPFQTVIIYYLIKTQKVGGKNIVSQNSSEQAINISIDDIAKNPQLAENCRKLLLNNEVSPAIKLLQGHFKQQHTDEYNDLLLLQKKWNDLQREISLNLISHEQKELKLSKLSHSVLMKIEKIA